MEFKTFVYDTQIKEHHLDSFGHVNNAIYLSLYEEARWEFITENGYGLKEVQMNKKGPVVLDVTCRFKREITNREKIKITSHTLEVVGKISKIKQQILKEDGSVSSEALFTFGFMDLKERKLIEAPEAWLKAMGKI